MTGRFLPFNIEIMARLSYNFEIEIMARRLEYSIQIQHAIFQSVGFTSLFLFPE
jgi:hypothetical protein